MRRLFGLLFFTVGVGAALLIALKWYGGQPATSAVWILAIIGALQAAMDALEHAFPQLKN